MNCGPSISKKEAFEPQREKSLHSHYKCPQQSVSKTVVTVDLDHYEFMPIHIGISPPKTEIFQIKNCDIFHISAQNIDCGYSLEPPRRGGSNEYPQSMFLSRTEKNNVYPCKRQFYYIKVGVKGVKII